MVFVTHVESSTERLLLLAYASHCGQGDLLAWPSRNRIHDLTLLDLKTISATTKRLVTRGVLVDTGKRVGATGRVRVYRLELSNESKSGPIKSGHFRNDSKSGINPIVPSNESDNGLVNQTKSGTRKESLNQSGKREEAKAPSASSPLPSDWMPIEQLVRQAQLSRPDLDISNVARKFVAHAHAHDWRRSNWDASFMKWVHGERPGLDARRADRNEVTQAAHSLARAEQVIAESRQAAKTMVLAIPDHLRHYIGKARN